MALPSEVEGRVAVEVDDDTFPARSTEIGSVSPRVGRQDSSGPPGEELGGSRPGDVRDEPALLWERPGEHIGHVGEGGIATAAFEQLGEALPSGPLQVVAVLGSPEPRA